MIDFLTYAALLGKIKKMIKQILAFVGKGLKYKGAVNYFQDLPSDAEIGDVYTVKYIGTSGTSPDGREYAYGEYEGVNQWLLMPGVTDVKMEDGASLVKDGIAIIPNPDVNSAEGAYHLRYYKNTLQYYDGSEWITLSLANLLI